MANAHQVRPTTNSSDEVNLEIDDSQTVRQLDQQGQQPPILVLSRDGELVETVRKAAPRGTRVTHAPDLDHVAEKLPNLRPGVLVADTASAPDIPSMVAQLTQHFPELVVVVAGKREDSASLMQLTATGRIFRFLLTPLSHGQTRLALEAAVAQHVELNNQAERLHGGASQGGSGGANKNYVMTYGALAAGLLVVIVGIWFGVKQLTGGNEAPAPVPTATNSAIAGRQDPVVAELNLAKEAFAAGKYDSPSGESALDFYRNALRLDPTSEAAKQGIRDVANRVLETAEQSLTAERLEEAIRNIERARDIDPNHPRLAFLDTQIQRERERFKLSQAQEVGNRVRNLVAQANDRMQAGRMLSPAGNSARDSLVEARRLDPTDPTVSQAIRELTNMLTDEARKSLAAGKLEEAQSYIAGAKQLGSASPTLAEVERSVTTAMRGGPVTPVAAPQAAPNQPTAVAAVTPPRRATPAPAPAATPPPVAGVDGMIAEVRQRLNEDKLVDPPGDSARDALVNLRNAAPNRPEVEELAKTLSLRLLEKAKSAMRAKAYERSTQLLTAAREVGSRFNESAIAQVETELTAAREENALQTSIISASNLKRTKIVNAAYPESARKRRIEGWVELAFTIQPNGSVEAVEVQNASPADVFDDAAIRAVRQWRYEPVTRNGVPVPQRAMVRVKFAL